jgi:hypothetical protein
MHKTGAKRMRMYKKAVGLVVFLGAPALVSQSNLPMSVSGIVVAEEAGRPVEGAFVVVRDYQQLDQSYVSSKWESRTAADGSFSFVMQTGCYDILVSANARFLPFAQRICIRAERSSVLKIRLKAYPHPILLQR